MHPPSHYHRLRERFTPQKPSLILIAESPPASGNYFYDTSGKPSEHLFSAVMKSFLKIRPATKEEGLTALCDAGILLLDATYEPVNDGRANRERDATIIRDYPQLVKRIREATMEPRTPLLLIKANVCRILEPLLERDGFTVINQGCVVPFPSNGHQGRFALVVAELMRRSPWANDSRLANPPE